MSAAAPSPDSAWSVAFDGVLVAGVRLRPRPARMLRARGAGHRRCSAPLAALAWLLLSPCLAAQPAPDAAPSRRGPIEAREEWLLAQPRLTLPALAPDLLAPGRSELRLHFDWGNDFGWRQDGAGETPRDRRFLIDGEHRTVDVGLRYGWRPGVEVSLRVPLQWRGTGALDGVIDWFHGFTRKLGLPDNERRLFLRDQLRVAGVDAQGRPLAWTGAAGTGLGRVELGARVALTRAARASSADRGAWAVAFVPRLTFPSGSGPFDAPGVEGGAQLVAAHGLGTRWDVFLGAGGTFGSARRIDGLTSTRARPHAFVVFEWRPTRRLSLLAQADAAGRSIEDVAEYPALASYLRLGAQLDLGPRWRLAGGFSENIANQQGTTDFGVFVSLARRF